MGNSNQLDVIPAQLGYPFSSNKIWKIAREGKINELLKQFQAGHANCYQPIQQSSLHNLVHEAIVLDRREIFKLCEVYGADWEQADANGVTPLMKAAGLNRQFFAKRLIELGVKTTQKDPRGRTAADYARMYRYQELADLLDGKWFVTYNIMSLYSNQGPLKSLSRSGSVCSLYSQKSAKSEQQLKVINEANPQTNYAKQHVSPQKINDQIKPAQHKSAAKVQKSTEIHQQMQRSNIKTINSSSIKQSQELTTDHLRPLKKSPFNTFINDAAERYALFNQQQQIKAVEPVKKISQSSRRLSRLVKKYQVDPRNSQDAKWPHSQSLAVKPSQQKSFLTLIRRYHKHASIMTEQMNRFLSHFEMCERWLLKQPYRLSLFDTLDIIKVKMENYLQSKINLNNVSSVQPTADWSQEQLTNFYGNYRRMLIAQQLVQNHQPYVLKKYKNCVFFGRMEQSHKSEGVLHYFNGKCFQGKFAEDQKYYGLEIDDNQLYLGQFRKGVRHGEGLRKSADTLSVGTFHQGLFSKVGGHPEQSRQNVKHGFEITIKNFSVFKEGLILSKNQNGDYFIGYRDQNGFKTQEGLQIFANGDVYIGKYEGDSPEGYGQYYWENGSFYRGQFLSGMRHGRGRWQMINGDSYQGQYMNDKKNGKGVYLWKNGSKYTGHFENDYRHGYGQIIWQDGRTYKGEWVNGIEKNTIITIDNGMRQTAKQSKTRSFRTVSYGSSQKRRIPMEKLKSLYNPSFH